MIVEMMILGKFTLLSYDAALFYISCQALDLGRGAHPGKYIVEEIWEELAKAKYMEWEHESTRRSWDLQNLK